MEKRLNHTNKQDMAFRDESRRQRAAKPDLPELLRTQPEKGMERLVKEYNGYVYAIVAGRLRGFSQQDIEECVSDVFYSVYEKRAGIDESIAPLKAYICTVAKRKAIDRLRRLTSAKAMADGVSIDDTRTGYGGFADENTCNPQQESGGIDTHNIDAEQLVQAIRTLGKTDARIITLKYYFDMTNAEIGRELDMKENTVSKRASRALAKLGGILNKEDFL